MGRPPARGTDRPAAKIRTRRPARQRHRAPTQTVNPWRLVLDMTNPLIKSLHDRYQTVFAEEKALAQRAADEQRSFTGEEDRQWRELDGELEALGARIKDTVAGEKRAKELAESIEAVQRRPVVPAAFAAGGGGGRPGSAVALLESDTELRRFLYGESRSYELHLPATVAERRALMANIAGRGGYEQRDLNTGNVPLPETFIAQLYSYIVDTSSIRQCNPRVFSGTSGEPLTIPRSTAEGSAQWVAEGAPLQEDDPTLDAVVLNSHKVGKIVEVSSEMLADEGFDLTGFIAESAGRNIGITTDAGYISGDGSGKPTGLLGTVSIAETGPPATAAVSADQLIDLVHGVLPGYRTRGCFLMNDVVIREVRKLKDLQGRYLWEPRLTEGEPDRILGHPVYSDPNMPVLADDAIVVIFGDFGGYWIRDVSPVRFERSDDYKFGTDMVAFRAIFRTDGKQGDTQSLAAFKCGPAGP